MSDPGKLLNELILALNDTYGRQWIIDLERSNFDLWKEIGEWQWADLDR